MKLLLSIQSISSTSDRKEWVLPQDISSPLTCEHISVENITICLFLSPDVPFLSETKSSHNKWFIGEAGEEAASWLIIVIKNK